MPRQLRYTSFGPGELEQRLRELAPQASFSTPLPNGRDSAPLRKSHTFDVTFPDGKSGTCRYERGGLRWHLFHFTYADGAGMPRQSCTERLGNDARAIEQKGVELAGLCYKEAIRVERDHYFRRASEPSDGSRKKRPDCFRMKAARAKELAGLYALCQRSANSLVVVGTMFSDLEKANQEWRERANTRLVVGCCNRLDRCWELPRYNTLYAECDPRPAQTQETEASVP